MRNPFKPKKEEGIQPPVTPPVVPSFNSIPLTGSQAVTTPASVNATALKRGRKASEDGEIDEQDIPDRHGKKPRESMAQSSAVSQSSARSLMPPPPPPGAPGSHLRSNFSNMALGNPSFSFVAPSSSQLSVNSQTSVRSGLRSVSRAMLYSNDFMPGTIITAPHHCTALKPDADPNTDSNFCQSSIATICSKRRMMIVLWSYQRNVLVLPLETHSRRGLESIPEHYKDEYICLVDRGDNNFWNESIYEPLVVTRLNGRPVGKLSSARLTNSVTIDHLEDIKIVGRISTQSTLNLHKIWMKMANKAIDDGWEDARVAYARRNRSASRSSAASRPPSRPQSRPESMTGSRPPSRPASRTSWHR